jgi:predicted Zn-dependent peptidase
VISYKTFKLENGLRVIHHLDNSKSSAVVNVLYNVGARDENPNKTGFAHLFEHLMFGGSENIPSYDTALQKAGGTNNAFTSNDLTNYYIEIPCQNIETAFWLESDRMKKLAFSEESLSVQKGVVVEEFKQRYLNQPYGKAYMHLRENAYKVHPYRWATIGKEISHIEDATLDDVKAFFHKFYNPSNAILCVAGNITLEQTKELSEKWFGPIKTGIRNKNEYPQEPVQVESTHFIAPQINAQQAIYMAFHKPSKREQSHYVADLMSDILANGKTSILYSSLVERDEMFSSLSVYVGDDLDPGLVYIIGMVNNDKSIEEAEASIWNELGMFKSRFNNEEQLNRNRNKLITAKTYQDTNLLNKAMALCMAENQGDISQVNQLISNYNLVSVTDINKLANNILIKENCTTILYPNYAK